MKLKLGSSRNTSQAWVAIAVGGLVVLACAPKQTAKEIVVKECVLREDQANSIQGKWDERSVKLSLRASQWSGEEVGAIQAGAGVWNEFFNTSKGFNIFDVGPSGSGYTSNANQTAPQCGSTIPDGTVIYKRQTSWSASTAAVAVTTTCYQVRTGHYPKFVNAIMEVNYKNFFTPGNGNRFPDLQSVVIHELGHLLGLDHSCGPLGKPNQTKSNVGCPDAASEPTNDLVTAVMYPVLLFDGDGHSIVKTTLGTNDQGRANCVYEE